MLLVHHQAFWFGFSVRHKDIVERTLPDPAGPDASPETEKERHSLGLWVQKVFRFSMFFRIHISSVWSEDRMSVITWDDTRSIHLSDRLHMDDDNL